MRRQGTCAGGRGSRARGSLKTFEIESKALDARRKLTVYLPPEFGPGRARCVVYAADGEQMDRYACFLEPLITAHKLPPTVVVGVHSGGYVGGAPDYKNYDTKKDMRAQEYFPGINSERFAKHEIFFCSEVTEWAEQQWKVSGDPKDLRDLWMLEWRPVCLRDGDAASRAVWPHSGVLGSRRRGD